MEETSANPGGDVDNFHTSFPSSSSSPMIEEKSANPGDGDSCVSEDISSITSDCLAMDEDSPDGSVSDCLAMDEDSPHGSVSDCLAMDEDSPDGSVSDCLAMDEDSPDGSVSDCLAMDEGSPDGSVSDCLARDEDSPDGSVSDCLAMDEDSPDGSVSSIFHSSNRTRPEPTPGDRPHSKEEKRPHIFSSRAPPCRQKFKREYEFLSLQTLLLSGVCSDRRISVIRLAAPAGAGKTTLAHLVYTDSKVCEFFDTRAWVCVDEQLDSKGLAKAIAESLAGISCNLTQLTEVRETLREELTGKRFLLVLDNVYRADESFWSCLLASLNVAAKGSVVMVTTRNEMLPVVKERMCSYRLSRLSLEECWSIFWKCAFALRNPSQVPSFNETLLCKNIIAKCDGIPLAVMALGGLVVSEPKEASWNAILERILQGGNKIFLALKISYHHLPRRLKRCFEFCSLFPKGYIFEKDVLVRLWSSAGFIESDEGKAVEDIGTEYFDELLRRSFFQRSPICDPKEGKYVMHDLFHELAEFLSANTYCRIENLKISSVHKNISHASFVPREIEMAVQFEPFRVARNLHTLLLINRFPFTWNGSLSHIKNLAILDDLFQNFKYLRTLDLSFSTIEVLPDSVANLEYLCYLGLRNTNIKRMPESVCNLTNLQFLELGACSDLHELPNGMKNLTNLRHLNVWKESGFVCMPAGIGELTSLRSLATFNVGTNDRYCGIRELKDLVNLGGALCIAGLENVANGDAREANLKYKGYLQALTLQWCDNCGELEGEDSAETAREVLRSLQPHSNLEELIIRDYFGYKFPSWMGDRSFSKLISITLDNCSECNILPPLGQLPSLTHLSMRRMDGVRCLGHEFCGSDAIFRKRFPQLKTLNIWELSELAEWNGVENGDFPRLHSLSISRCLRLRRLPSFTSLVELSLHFCTQLPDLPTLPCLESLKIEGIQSLASLSLPLDLPAVKMVEIKHCNQLLTVGSLSHLSSLKRLKVVKCPKLRFLPNEWLPSVLQVVDIGHGCPLLSQWCPHGFEKITDGNQACRKLVRHMLQHSQVHVGNG